MRRGGVLVLMAAAAVCISGHSVAQRATFDDADAADSRIRPDKPGQPSRYIIVFKDHVSDPRANAYQLAAQHGASLHFVYEHSIKGFAATLPFQAAAALGQNPNIAYVELDPPAEVFTVQNPSPSWGLDRIDQVDLPLDNSFAYGNDASGYDGFPVNIYIIDSGVYAGHSDFGGRVQFVPNGSNGDFVGDGHGSADDCLGHGTHVAGIAAGGTHGVAKGAAIWAARVIDCIGFGTASMAIAAVDWITANGIRPAVVNMSLGYPNVQSLHDAVEASIDAGFLYVVAAGNRIVPQDACEITPANVADVLTIGATNIDDDESYFSNFGACVDLLAPGENIISTAITGGTEIRSGTSMATPHVTGTVATYLCNTPDATQGQAAAALLGNAAPGRITFHLFSQACTTPNLLLQNEWIGACTPGPPNTPPIVASALADTTVDEDATVDYGGDLDAVFTDVEDGGDLAFALQSNSNPALVTATLDAMDHTIDLVLAANQYGLATIVVRATDSGYLFRPPAYSEDTFVLTVTSVNDAPVAVVTSSSAVLICDVDASTSFDIDGSIAGYAWDFGDGNTAVGATITHRYSAGGSYWVTMTVTDDGGLSDMQSFEVVATANTHNDEKDIITLEDDEDKPVGRDMVFLTEGASGSMPTTLLQNVPNPFNPTTMISFSVADEGHVTLRVYDVMGRRVRTLVDERLLAATHVVEWGGETDRGAAVASGVYFYRLVAGEFSAVKRMILLK